VYEKIIYPTDFSEGSGKVLEHLKEMKKYLGEVVILHVANKYGFDSVMEGCERVGLDVKDVMNSLLKKEEEAAEKIRKDLEKEGIRCRIRIDVGDPASRIIKTAEEENASAIIIGAHGKGFVDRLLLGSVTEKVLRQTTKPVVVIK
jgi:nucleotide-binding universal stress UspA family protein